MDDAPEIQNYYEDIWHKQQVRHEVMIEHVTSADSQDVEEERRQILIAEERLKYKIDTEGLMEMGNISRQLTNTSVDYFVNIIREQNPENCYIHLHQGLTSKEEVEALVRQFFKGQEWIFFISNRGADEINGDLTGFHWIFSAIAPCGTILHGDTLGERPPPNNLLFFLEPFFVAKFGNEKQMGEVQNLDCKQYPNFPNQESDSWICGFSVLSLFAVSGFPEIWTNLVSKQKTPGLECLSKPGEHSRYLRQIFS